MAQPKEVKRYRAGRRPIWDQEVSKTDKSTQKRETPQTDKTTDNRLARLEQINDIGDEQERLDRHRRIIQEAAVIMGEDEEISKEFKISATINEKDGGEEDLEKRRERARFKKQTSDEEDVQELPMEADEDNENEEESSSVSESDSGEEEEWDQFMPSRGPRLQPRFVKKEKRQTIVEKEQIQKEIDKMKEDKDKQTKERKERTRILLKEAVERERSNKINGEEEVALTDDDDDKETQHKEYELWKLRELVRIRRERDEREKYRLERLDVERRRNMTDEEVATEKRKNKEGFKERKYMKYLQKYYHKGAFYNTELTDMQQNHDWTAPTGEDKWIDRTMLPKVMQVKNFGRAGRTKYTHLKNEDTSKQDDPWAAATYNPQYIQKMGGTGGFERLSKKRKITNVV